jgi:hypothetical protein
MSRLSVFIKGGNTAEPDACYSDAFSHIPVDYSITVLLILTTQENQPVARTSQWRDGFPAKGLSKYNKPLFPAGAGSDLATNQWGLRALGFV